MRDIGVIDRSGFSLRYVVEGSGPTMLVIGSSLYYQRTFSQNLRQHFRMVFLDHKGFAPASGVFSEDIYSLDILLDDIEFARNQLGLGKVILVGHSGHGYMALEFAKKYPEGLSRLVLLALSPRADAENFAAADRYFADSVCPDRKALLSNNFLSLEANIEKDRGRAFIARMLCFGPMIWYQHDFDASDLWSDVVVTPEIIEYLWGKEFRQLDAISGVENITVPVFLGLGRYDYWNPPYLWESVRGKFGRLSIRVFETSGHTPQFEQPEVFDHELIEWMKT